MVDRPMTELKQNSRAGRRSVIAFGIVAAITLVVLIVIGVAGKNVGPNKAQLNTESQAASGSQNP